MVSQALRSRADMLGSFRSEFRPLDSMQPLFSLVSPPYRGNTVSYDGELALAFGGFLLCFGFVALFCSGLGAFWCFYSPSSSCVSLPFNDDLGTPPTWRPYSWKKIPLKEQKVWKTCEG